MCVHCTVVKTVNNLSMENSLKKVTHRFMKISSNQHGSLSLHNVFIHNKNTFFLLPEIYFALYSLTRAECQVVTLFHKTVKSRERSRGNI